MQDNEFVFTFWSTPTHICYSQTGGYDFHAAIPKSKITTALIKENIVCLQIEDQDEMFPLGSNIPNELKLDMMALLSDDPMFPFGETISWSTQQSGLKLV